MWPIELRRLTLARALQPHQRKISNTNLAAVSAYTLFDHGSCQGLLCVLRYLKIFHTILKKNPRCLLCTRAQEGLIPAQLVGQRALAALSPPLTPLDSAPISGSRLIARASVISRSPHHKYNDYILPLFLPFFTFFSSISSYFIFLCISF